MVFLLLALAGCGGRALGLLPDATPGRLDRGSPPSSSAAGADAGGAVTAPSNAVGWSLAVDDDALYWTSVSGRVLRRAKLGHAPDQVLADGQGELATLAIDASSVYFTVCPPPGTSCSIRRVAKAGGAQSTLVEGQHQAGALVVDAGYVYWATGDGAILKRAKSGGPVEPLSASTEPAGSARTPHFLGSDATRIYWSAAEVIWSVSKNGGGATQLVGKSETRNPVGLAVADGLVYWAAAGEVAFHPDGTYGYPDGALRRVPAAGGPAVTIAAGMPWPSGIVVGENAVELYFTSVTHGLLKVPNQVNTGSNQILESGAASHVIALDATQLYWSSGGDLRARPIE
jgi:hypothetical protein